MRGNTNVGLDVGGVPNNETPGREVGMTVIIPGVIGTEEVVTIHPGVTHGVKRKKLLGLVMLSLSKI